jgi:hypothetical protein
VEPARPHVLSGYTHGVFLFYIAVGVVVLIAIVLHASAACPSCGLQLVEGPLDRLGQKDRMDHCRHCGWKRRR